MKLQIAFAGCIVLCLQTLAGGFLPQRATAARKQADSPAAATAAFAFGGVNYFHRFTEANQHEYTPAAQADLKRWADMVTVNYYPQAKDGDALAATANAVLETYKANGAQVLRTDSSPRRGAQPAEHLIVVLFPRPDFIEASFARFKTHNGAGVALIYAHRIYGTKAGHAMSAWLKTHGPATEAMLMRWKTVPPPPPPPPPAAR